MMVKVLVYAYASGVFSSRKIERRLHEDLAFRMPAAANFPRHRTICDFRAFHLKELSDQFVQVVRYAALCTVSSYAQWVRQRYVAALARGRRARL